MNDCLINSILCGDSSFLLKQLPDESVDLVVTSPPYYLQRGYNDAAMGVGHETSVDRYIDTIMEVFEEVVRVVKPTGNIVFNLGDKYQKKSLLLVPFRFAIQATETCNVRLVNNITWDKKNPTPRQFDRRLVSATEPFFHFAKTDEYYHDIDSFMVDEQNKVRKHKPTPKLGAKYRTLIDKSELSKLEKKDAHASLDEVIREVRQTDIYSFRMKIRGVHAEAFGGQSGGRKSQIEKRGFTIIRLHGKSMKKDVINSPVEAIPGMAHQAIFPLSIIRELVNLLCPKTGIVLDPYVGSGTTALAAKMEGRRYIGMDVDPTYCELAIKRIQDV